MDGAQHSRAEARLCFSSLLQLCCANGIVRLWLRLFSAIVMFACSDSVALTLLVALPLTVQGLRVAPIRRAAHRVAYDAANVWMLRAF